MPFFFRLVGAACLALVLVCPLQAQPEPQATTPLPVDPAVKIGTLPNGLTYFIRHNVKPENRAELRLVVNVGSILEDDDQQGLAHFVEHMAFNGTTDYEKQALVDFLESAGMRLGPDLNAYTSFDETVYMLQVPTDSTGMLPTALHILRQWATEVTFEDEEIDKERGVVLEEWRLGRGANARMRDKQFPVLFQDSRYAERLPIGDPEIIQHADYETVRRFYQDWYRPELMAVVAVGDFDVAEVEALIQEEFSDIPVATTARPRALYSVPGHAETLVTTASDPEATYSSVSVVFKHARTAENSYAAYRQGLVERLYNRMFNSRLSEKTQDADPPFVFANAGKGAFVRTLDAYNLNAVVREGQYLRGLEVLLTEAERVRRHGFTPSELERQKANLLRGLERAFNERDKTESRVYAGEYVRHYLTEEPIPGIAFEYEVASQLLPTVQLDEVNALAAAWITAENRVIMADGPEKEGLVLPAADALLGVFDQVAGATIAPYAEEVSEDPLMAALPTPGTVVDQSYREDLDVHRLQLSNGITVVMKPTDFKNDQVMFAATSPGGTSLASDAVYASADLASALVGGSGVGAFGPVELQKKLAGKAVGVAPTIREREEGLSGSAAPSDLEILFQLVHLYVTAPPCRQHCLRLVQVADG